MRRGFTMTEMLISMVVVMILVGIVHLMSLKVVSNYNRLVREFDKVVSPEGGGEVLIISHVSKGIDAVWDVLRRFGRNVSEVSVSETEIDGKYHVLNDSIGVRLYVETRSLGEDEVETDIMLQPEGGDPIKLVSGMRNVSITFRGNPEPSTVLGAGVEVVVRRWIKDEEGNTAAVTREMFIPFLNVK